MAKRIGLGALSLVTLMAIFPAMAAAGQEVKWTAVFSDATPVDSNYSEAYCKAHTPTVMVTTIKEITSNKGVKALNGIWVKYVSYKTEVKDHLYFNVVDAEISGVDAAGKAWKTPMKLYEQTLDEVGVTYTVWSTPACKGTFLGTPTLVNKPSCQMS